MPSVVSYLNAAITVFTTARPCFDCNMQDAVDIESDRRVAGSVVDESAHDDDLKPFVLFLMARDS